MNRNIIVSIAGLSIITFGLGGRHLAAYDLDSYEAQSLLKETVGRKDVYTTGLRMRQDDGLLSSGTRTAFLIDGAGFDQIANSLNLHEVNSQPSPRMFEALWSRNATPNWWTPQPQAGKLYYGEINGQKHAIQYDDRTCQLYWFAMPMLKRTPKQDLHYWISPGTETAHSGARAARSE